jgi:hypothetical protein
MARSKIGTASIPDKAGAKPAGAREINRRFASDLQFRFAITVNKSKTHQSALFRK